MRRLTLLHHTSCWSHRHGWRVMVEKNVTYQSDESSVNLRINVVAEIFKLLCLSLKGNLSFVVSFRWILLKLDTVQVRAEGVLLLILILICSQRWRRGFEQTAQHKWRPAGLTNMRSGLSRSLNEITSGLIGFTVRSEPDSVCIYGSI